MKKLIKHEPQPFDELVRICEETIGAQYDDFKIFSHQSTAIDTWLTLKSLKSKDLQLQRAYNQNIVPYKGKGTSHTEKWIASGYSARTGFISGNGYLEQRFPEEAMFPGKIRFMN